MSVNDRSQARAVALLARAGAAREKLRAALDSAGGQLVLEDDPQQLDEASLRDAAPQVVVIALEPAVEDALERLDAVLQSPGILLILEEAELAARREGWEEQRWIRHLAAKLQGHDQVLPPGAGEDSLAAPLPRAAAVAGQPSAVEPALEATPASAGAPLFELEPAFAPAVAAADADADEVMVESADVTIDADGEVLAFEGLALEPAADTSLPAPESNPWDPAAAEDGGGLALAADAGLADELSAALAAFELPSVEEASVEEASAPTPAGEAEPAPGWDELMALEGARTANSEPAPAPLPAVPPPLPPLPDAPDAPAAPAPAAPTVPDISQWSLVSDEELVAPVAAVPAPEPVITSFLSSELSLVELDDSPAGMAAAALPVARRLVLVLAGIGGPDAVRRLLAGLPADLDGAVLVQMRLNGGRYDNLVRQLERVTGLPVALATAGEMATQGQVHILPDGIGVTRVEKGYQFVETPEDVIAVLSPVDCAVMMLSGAEVGLVNAALGFAAKGGLVAGQSGAGCYAPEAGNQLAAAGLLTASPEELAQELGQRWG